MAARDMRSAPPNVSQVEAYNGDLEAATEEQINPETDEINEKVAKANEKAMEEHKKLRDKRVGDGAVKDTRAEYKDEEKPKAAAKSEDKK